MVIVKADARITEKISWKLSEVFCGEEEIDYNAKTADITSNIASENVQSVQSGGKNSVDSNSIGRLINNISAEDKKVTYPSSIKQTLSATNKHDERELKIFMENALGNSSRKSDSNRERTQRKSSDFFFLICGNLQLNKKCDIITT